MGKAVSETQSNRKSNLIEIVFWLAAKFLLDDEHKQYEQQNFNCHPLISFYWQRHSFNVTDFFCLMYAKWISFRRVFEDLRKGDCCSQQAHDVKMTSFGRYYV